MNLKGFFIALLRHPSTLEEFSDCLKECFEVIPVSPTDKNYSLNYSITFAINQQSIADNHAQKVIQHYWKQIKWKGLFKKRCYFRQFSDMHRLQTVTRCRFA